MLHSFKGGLDGGHPIAGLVFDTSGALYGTTASTACCETIFKLTPPSPGQTQWTHTRLYRFQIFATNHPWGVIFDTNGALYGTTQVAGTVFKLAPPAPGQTQWTETVLYSFNGGSDGLFPRSGLIFDTSGALYGTTGSDGTSHFGTVFKLAPPSPGQTQWTKNVLYSFKGGSDGKGPNEGSLIFDTSGALYGATYRGGTADNGTVFKLE